MAFSGISWFFFILRQFDSILWLLWHFMVIMAFYIISQLYSHKNEIIYGLYLQIVLPCSAYYYFPVFGAWMIGAAVSLSDPGKKHRYLNTDISITASS
jgi:hypothetical protein